MASRNPLNADAIVQAMADALPTHEKGDTNSDLSSSYEALALFTHACMTNLGFRLLGFNEDQKIESECARLAPRLPPTWNATFNSHSFVYAHTQSSLTYIIKVDRLGSRAEIRGVASETDRAVRFDISPRDYVSSSALPLRITLLSGGDAATEDRSDLPQKLSAVFISDARIKDLASLVKISIVQRLIPRLNKEGYEESNDPDDRTAQDDARRSLREEAGPDRPHPVPGHGGDARHPPGGRIPDPLPAPARPYPYDDPLAAPPRRPGAVPGADFPPPDFEDEHQTNRPLRGGIPGGGIPLPGGDGRSPFDIGHDDLHPPGLGPRDPLRPSFAGGIGGGGLPRPGFGGGMHPTFDDPLFGGQRGGDGGDGSGLFDPQVPPGARYDPVGPGAPPYGRRPFGGAGGSGTGGDGSSFGGGFGGGIF